MTAAGAREGFHTVTPCLMVSDADALIRFLRAALGAEETFRAVGSAGGIHAEVRVGDSMIMIGGSAAHRAPAALYLYLPDVDAAYERALEAGGESYSAPADTPFGDCMACVRDTFGNAWYIATHGVAGPA
jgi:PhnB protein